MYLIHLFVDELEDSVAEITNVGNQFVVDLGLEVIPVEFCIRIFGSVDQKLVSVDFAWNLGLGSTITENSSSSALGELKSLFIVQIFSGGEGVEQSPVLASSEQS
jgi:hypothetical protein